MMAQLGEAELPVVFDMMPRQLLPAFRVEHLIESFSEALGECSDINCSAACLWLIINRRDYIDP
jgi:hypothetical protein